MKLRTLLHLSVIAFLTFITTTAQAGAGALNFNFSNFIDVGVVLQGGHSYTKEAWIKAKASQTDNIITGSDDPFWLSGGHLRAAHHWTGQFTDVVDTAMFPLNIWVHVAVTYDSVTHTLRLYRDGVQVAVNTEASTYNTSFEQVGAYNDSNPFDGDIDEVRIWDRAICAPELNLHKNCELLGLEPGLLVYYKFNEGLPLLGNLGLTTVLDASGNGRNGILKRFTLTGLLGNFITGVSFGTYNTYTPPAATATSAPTTTGATLTANDAAAYQWMKDGAWIAGANAKTYTATPGNYKVTITAANGCSNTSATVAVAAPIQQSNLNVTIGVSPVKTVSGQDDYTIYNGYGPQSVTLTANITGGTGPYTYEWSGDDIQSNTNYNNCSDRRSCRNNNRKKWGYSCGNSNNRYNRYNNDDNDDDDGSNAKTVVVSPNNTEKYTLKITDANGNTKTVTQTIKVKDVSGYCGKVLICYETQDCYYSCNYCCHHSKRTVVKTYSVSSSYVPYYLADGAKLGSCGQNKGGVDEIVDIKEQEFTAYPNPSNGIFSVTVPEPGNTQIMVMDVNGKVVAQQNIENGVKQYASLDITNAANGMYFVRINNNGKVYSTKVIKQ